MLMINAIQAMNKTPVFETQTHSDKIKRATKKKVVKVKKKGKHKFTQQEAAINRVYQLSTVIKMAIDEHTNAEIMEATNTCYSFINKCKREFGLLRPGSEENRAKIKAFLLSAPVLTYTIKEISEHIGLSTCPTYKLILDMPSVKKGTVKGFKHNYYYDSTEPDKRELISRGRIV